MPTLTIRNLPQATHDALKSRAARNGRSMEAEARLALAELAEKQRRQKEFEVRVREAQAILGAAVLGGPSLSEELIAERRAEAARE
jgi:antitoxin FitA